MRTCLGSLKLITPLISYNTPGECIMLVQMVFVEVKSAQKRGQERDCVERQNHPTMCGTNLQERLTYQKGLPERVNKPHPSGLLSKGAGEAAVQSLKTCLWKLALV